ncbi:MAG: IS21 family transposase [Bacteroidetes bacterium]|nr:IS21 family transposase [Bacteroidota bacterium]
MEDWVTIRNLRAKNPEMSFREIAKLLGISHNTVKSALSRDSLPEYKRASKISESLLPFEDFIYKKINVKKQKGSRILSDIISKGYTGSRTTFYEYYSKTKESPRKDFEPYETNPGEQSQFDWSPYTVRICGELTKIILFSYINGFSRYIVLEVSLTENQGAVFEAIEKGMIESEGVPTRIQTDNAKVFIKNASKNNFQWNERYLHFCGHYGFAPSRSLPRHPWSKGKIEKPFSYIENHFIVDSSFESFEDLVIKLKDFQEKMNNRVHSTTKRPPKELLEKEKDAFIFLPEQRYVGIKEEIRKANFDCLISFNGSRYSVPWHFAGKHVWIRISKGYFLEVYSQANKLVAKHRLSLKKSAVIIEQSHYRGNNNRGGNFERLKQVFLESFPNNELFIEKLKAQKRINASYQLFQIIELSKLYLADDFMEAINKALYYNVFNYSFLAGFLEKNFKQHFQITDLGIKKQYIGHNIKRELTQYQLH